MRRCGWKKKAVWSRSTLSVLISFSLLLVGCATGVPPLVLGGDEPPAPAGPTVASLMQNIKCELWDTARDEHVLKLFQDVPNGDVINFKDGTAIEPPRKGQMSFTLTNLFQEIEYVADLELTLDVTGSIGVSPSLNLSKYYAATMAGSVFPATGFLLSAGAQFNETSHRYIELYSTIDFGRLVESPPPGGGLGMGPRLAEGCGTTPYKSHGLELSGDLGLKETLATGFIAAAMDDIAALPDDAAAPAKPVVPAGPKPKPPLAVDAPTVVVAPQSAPQNVISAQVDFTIVEGGNIGPNWTLRYFKGPTAGSGGSSGATGAGGGAGGGGGNQGLINGNRQVKDQINITFVPVCIRQKYTAVNIKPGVAWMDYDPPFAQGTPEWAHFLPPCTENYRELQRNARTTARTYNQIQTQFFDNRGGN